MKIEKGKHTAEFYLNTREQLALLWSIRVAANLIRIQVIPPDSLSPNLMLGLQTAHQKLALLSEHGDVTIQ